MIDHPQLLTMCRWIHWRVRKSTLPTGPQKPNSSRGDNETFWPLLPVEVA